MTFEEMKKIVVDTLNCDEDKVCLYVVSVDYRWHLLCGLVLSAYEA